MTMPILPLCLLPLVATSSPTEPLVHKAEQALLSAKQLAIDVHVKTTGSFHVDIKTTWRWSPSSKLRIDIDGVLLGLQASTRFVSNGQYMQWPNNLERVSPDLDTGSRLMLFRLGASYNAIRIASGTLPDGLDGTGAYFARWTNVRIGPPKRIGRKRCIPIEHTMVVADGEIGQATLWIDAKTHLPVRRTMRIGYNGGMMDVEERYTRVKRPRRAFASSLFDLY